MERLVPLVIVKSIMVQLLMHAEVLVGCLREHVSVRVVLLAVELVVFQVLMQVMMPSVIAVARIAGRGTDRRQGSHCGQREYGFVNHELTLLS